MLCYTVFIEQNIVTLGGVGMDYISKKDLLNTTGISYGQLYRWKREKLIPEEWFIKQSSYTGQETFFPKDQIISRITSIMELKDQYSLEELAKLFEPEASAVISRDDLSVIEEMNKELLKMAVAAYSKEKYQVADIAFIVFLSELGKKSAISDEQFQLLIKNSVSAVENKIIPDMICTVIKINQEYHMVFSKDSHLIFDSQIEVIDFKALNEIISDLKIKYKNIFSK